MNTKVFREYDIRGVADRDFPNEFVHSLGRALATFVIEESSPINEEYKIAVGRDCRLTSLRIRNALVEGITSAGVHVIDIGVVPSPVLYFSAFHWKSDGAVIITGSHNPPQDNGFKILHQTSSIHGKQIQRLRTIMETEKFQKRSNAASIQEHDPVAPYLEYVKSQLPMGPRRFPICVDAGNGTGGPISTMLYKELGFTVKELYCEMDGTFPNHHPDPTMEENMEDLRAAVLRDELEVGIAFDGDSDRIGLIDGKGRIIWGDQLMILLGREILKEHPGATLIGEVKCSQALYDELRALGGNVIMWRVGHSLIKAKMKESGALLGGEMSGHIFFAHRFLGFDDGIYTGARLLELLSKSEKTLSELCDQLPELENTPEIRVPCPDEIKFAVVKEAIATLKKRDDVVEVIDIDGARARFQDGWGLVRASNTQPVIVLRCEASTKENVNQIRSILEELIADTRKKIE